MERIRDKRLRAHAAEPEHQEEFPAVARVVGAFGHPAGSRMLLNDSCLLGGHPRVGEVGRRVAGTARRFD